MGGKDTDKATEPVTKRARQSRPVVLPNNHVSGSASVYVGNLPFKATEDKVEEIFSTIGTIVKVVIGRTSKGRSKGFGWVRLLGIVSISAHSSAAIISACTWEIIIPFCQ